MFYRGGRKEEKKKDRRASALRYVCKRITLEIKRGDFNAGEFGLARRRVVM